MPFDLKINIDREFNVNGKKYNSIEDVPEDIREAVRKAVGTGVAQAQTKVIFNGVEYGSLNAMPPDIRKLYEDVMKAAQSGVMGKEISIGAGEGFKLEAKALSPEPVLGLRKFISGLALAMLFGSAIYYLL